MESEDSQNNQNLAVAMSTTVTTKIDFVSLFEKRKQNIAEFCEKEKKEPSEPLVNDPSHLFVLQDRRISWCPVFKAGSSTWLAFTLELSNKSLVRFIYQLKNKKNRQNFLYIS